MRPRWVWMVGLITLAVALQAVASEAAHAEHGPNLRMLLLQILNTLVLALILIRFAGRPIRDFLIQRSRGIRREIETSEARLSEARRALEELQARLERFEAEAQGIVAEMAAQAEAERVRAIERARATAERIRDEARRMAEQEIERARRELQNEAAELAATLAKELLRETLGPEDDRRLVREFVERLEETR
ncbi:MAG: ATP synthase F0 subunit B [Myxococcota bacterium]